MSQCMSTLLTPRLELVPISLEVVEAVMTDRRDEVARILQARLPPRWPGRALIERAFCAKLDEIRSDPERRLWGDRIAITRDEDRRIVGSVVFHGRAGEDGVLEVGYGVEEASQGLGFATEATDTMVSWALEQSGVSVVQATTMPWHRASIRVLEKIGFRRASTREHELLGEMVVFERAR